MGAYVSFPISERERRVDILRSFLSLEDKISSKRIKYGPIRGRVRTLSFNETKLQSALDSLERGESDYFQLLNYKIGEDWVRAYDSLISVNWSSWVTVRSNRSTSPVEERFGDAGSMRIGYPQPRFSADSESMFQQQLVTMMRKLWRENKLYWAFVHVGFHPLHPYSVGQDDVFCATRDGFPMTSFDHNLAVPMGIYKEYVGGAFWANFLNSCHASHLGGFDVIVIVREHPCELIQPIEPDGVLLQVAASPLTKDTLGVSQKYQRLRRFFSPSLMETGEDMMRIQKELMGSWRPPADAKRLWRKDLAEIRKKNRWN